MICSSFGGINESIVPFNIEETGGDDCSTVVYYNQYTEDLIDVVSGIHHVYNDRIRIS